MSGRMRPRTLDRRMETLRFGNLFLALGALLWLLTLSGCAATAGQSADSRSLSVAQQQASRSTSPGPANDADQDGVADSCDECAGTPRAVAVDSFGCPLSLYLHLRVEDSGLPFQEDNTLLGRLRKLAAILQANPGARLFIEAHTDDANTRTLQQRTSQQRADALAALLSEQLGVRKEQVKPIGYGASRPLVSNATPEGRKRNKRIELVIKGFYQRDSKAMARKPAVANPASVKPAAPQKFPEPLTLNFHSGSAAAGDLNSREQQAVAQMADYLRRNPQTALRIEGHTDSIGSEQANLALSEKRARQVYQTLVGTYGVNGARLSVRGYGEQQPVADNATEQGRSQNRRVRLVPYTPQSAPPAQVAYKPLTVPSARQDAPAPGQLAAALTPRKAQAAKSRIPQTRLSQDNAYEIKVSVTKRRLWLYELGANGKKELVRTYVVATPRPGKPAPWGSGEITRIEFDPWWYPTPNIKRDYLRRKGVRLPNSVPPGRRSNPMGKFKIHLSQGSGFRIHGTNAPSQIGRRVSSGCIRMRNADGLEMARALSVGTKVTVVR